MTAMRTRRCFLGQLGFLCAGLAVFGVDVCRASNAVSSFRDTRPLGAPPWRSRDAMLCVGKWAG